MEYGKQLDNNIDLMDLDNETIHSTALCDSNVMRYVGFEKGSNLPCLKEFFSKRNIQQISKKCTQLLMGVDKENRPIIVPDNRICSVMSDIYDGFRPKTGDIFTRYNIPTSYSESDYINDLTNQTIEVIVNTVKTTLEMEENNEKLTVWNSVLGTFNQAQLVAYPPIKVRNRRPMPMMFNMNY